MAELLDTFDANLNFICSQDRDEVHKRGLWHKTFYCWVVHNDKLVFQLRSINKSTNPGMLDVSSAGHILSGETIEDGVRELKEELGLNVNFEDLKSIGYFISASDKFNKSCIPYHNREFCYCFMLKDNTDLNKYKLQIEELDGIFEVDFSSGRSLFSGETNSIIIDGYIIDNGNLKKTAREVGISNFTKNGDFWLKVFNLAEDFINNKKYIKI